MALRTLAQSVADLEAGGHLVRITDEIDPHLEAAEIHRRVYQNDGPAVFFENVKGCRFPMVSNLFGSLERSLYMFRHTIENVRRLVELKVDQAAFWKNPLRYWRAPLTAVTMLPKKVRRGLALANEIQISDLPAMQSWPRDGGPFVTLPQVYTEHVNQPGLMHSNLGMYRIQLSGNEYETDREIGLHYQLHRGIGVHHQAAAAAKKPFAVNIFVGGHPAMSLGAVMPLPEGMSELTFAGALAGHRIPMAPGDSLPVYAEADFCIQGIVDPDRMLPEGPFGDHLGYYSLAHDFPVMKVTRVTHRPGAIWPFTVVGRPPQEDTSFGALIHELTGPIIPTVLPGVKSVQAVDAAGVHPLLLAVGSERYTPYNELLAPQELLTQANAILGQGQLSLAKYLLITNSSDDPDLDAHHTEAFFRHLLSRIDWKRDLHFQTRTTIDTLDYSGSGLNSGSKLVMAAAGPTIRELATTLPSDLNLPAGFRDPTICLPGVVAITGPKVEAGDDSAQQFCALQSADSPINAFPLIVLCDDGPFTARTLNNFLWITFTRSNPAADIHGIDSFIDDKHWGCNGSLVIDARIKPHHAPPLVEDPEVSKRVDALAAAGKSISKWL